MTIPARLRGLGDGMIQLNIPASGVYSVSDSAPVLPPTNASVNASASPAVDVSEILVSADSQADYGSPTAPCPSGYALDANQECASLNVAGAPTVPPNTAPASTLSMSNLLLLAFGVLALVAVSTSGGATRYSR